MAGLFLAQPGEDLRIDLIRISRGEHQENVPRL
jgi:hypothetical protein